MITDKEFEIMMKAYIENNLTIEKTDCGGDWGSKRFVEISLKLNNEIISSIYIDLD